MQVTTVGVTGSFTIKKLNYKDEESFPKVSSSIILVLGFWYKDFFRHLTIYIDNCYINSAKIYIGE